MLQLTSPTRRCFSILTTTALTVQCISNTFGQLPADSVTVARQPDTSIKDVSLANNGKLELIVVDSYGRQIPDIEVGIAYRGAEIARAKSNQHGVVAISALRPGLHSVTTPRGGVVYRFWHSAQAPPNSVVRPALILQEATARGQYGPMMGYPVAPMMGPSMMAPGLLATTVTAAAVAVVLIGKNEGSDSVVVPASP